MDDFAGLSADAATLWYRTTVEDSYAIHDLARYTVAAYAVDDPEKAVWRNGLNQALWDLDNADVAPVMALGAATWALAQTGGLSSAETLMVDGQVMSQADLPALLADQQMADGSFYTKFDHGRGGGFVETSVLGTLGLIAADELAAFGFEAEILEARLALAGGVQDPGGEVYMHLDPLVVPLIACPLDLATLDWRSCGNPDLARESRKEAAATGVQGFEVQMALVPYRAVPLPGTAPAEAALTLVSSVRDVAVGAANGTEAPLAGLEPNPTGWRLARPSLIVDWGRRISPKLAYARAKGDSFPDLCRVPSNHSAGSSRQT